MMRVVSPVLCVSLRKSGSNTSFVVISPHPDHPTAASGWHYQTAGIISDGVNRGGFSTGSYTQDIPTSGSATFNGRAYGYYKWSDSAQRFLTRANATITVDFSAGTADIETSDSRRVTYDDSSDISANYGNDAFKSFNNNTDASDANFLNFEGTLTYDASNKSFTGSVAGNNDGTKVGTGSATMRAYGPNAEEVGGVFRFDVADREYVGGFGAKR